jgi:hypothetical protein
VGLLKLNVERAEWDCLMGIQDKDWPKIRQVSAQVRHAHHVASVMWQQHHMSVSVIPGGDTPGTCVFCWLRATHHTFGKLVPALARRFAQLPKRPRLLMLLPAAGAADVLCALLRCMIWRGGWPRRCSC